MKLVPIALFSTVLLSGCATGPMTPEEQAQFDATLARIQAGNAQMAAQTSAMLGQIQNTNAAITANAYTPVQRSDGVWVYCIRTSSYTVNCRTQ